MVAWCTGDCRSSGGCIFGNVFIRLIVPSTILENPIISPQAGNKSRIPPHLQMIKLRNLGKMVWASARRRKVLSDPSIQKEKKIKMK